MKRTGRPLTPPPSRFLIWKIRPPGPEQIELERLFSSKQIDPTAKADNVRNSNAIFQRFSSSVFANHFRTTKANCGQAAVIPAAVAVDSSTISELGSSQNQSASQSVSKYEEKENDVDLDSNIEYGNGPFSTWMYTNHDTKTDFVCAAIALFAGSRNVNVSLSLDGMRVTVHYTWPGSIFKPSVLYSEAIKAKVMSTATPKVHAFASEMFRNGLTEKSSPQGTVTIKLPCQVKREIDSWKRETVTTEDYKVIYLEFTAYQKSLFIDEADTFIDF